MKKSHFISYFFIILVNFLLLCFVLLFTFEFSGLSHYLTLKYYPSYYQNLPLHKTNYYGKVLQKDPYSPFYKKYLHPYYFFSLPHKTKQIHDINNDIVSLDKNGFRENRLALSKNKNTKIGFLLGGSTAFSQYSSSNETTIASYMSNENIKFLNLNAPSWNSHQELISLLKVNQKFNYSVSLSLANDLILGIHNCKSNLIVDSPESFDQLDNHFKYIGKFKNNSLFSNLKARLANLFLDTSILYTLITRPEMINRRAKASNFNFNEITKNCLDKLIKIFIENQINMEMISKSRNAKHFLVIQPFFSLHNNSNHKLLKTIDSNFVKIINYVVNNVMTSRFCNKNCLNLANVFDLENKEEIPLIKNDKNQNYSPRIFIDEVHLTDTGNKILANAITRKFFN